MTAAFAVGGYPPGVISMQRLRSRLPLVVFIFLALVCVALLAFACACFTDHPVQAIERALLAITSLPGLTPVWSWIASLVAASILMQPRRALSRAPTLQLLQRFLS